MATVAHPRAASSTRVRLDRVLGKVGLYLVLGVLGTLATLMLPTEVTLIPTYLLFKEFGWLDTFLPLIVPFWFGGGAFNIFLMRQFFLSIPYDLDEAARIDGANSWRIFWQILLPLCR